MDIDIEIKRAYVIEQEGGSYTCCIMDNEGTEMEVWDYSKDELFEAYEAVNELNLNGWFIGEVKEKEVEEC
jgi:hypothetical protein